MVVFDGRGMGGGTGEFLKISSNFYVLWFLVDFDLLWFFDFYKVFKESFKGLIFEDF